MILWARLRHLEAIKPRLQPIKRTAECVQRDPQLDEATEAMLKAAQKAFERAILKLDPPREKPLIMKFTRPNPLPKASPILP